MIFCSVVMVSSNRRGGALHHPNRSAPRLGSRFAVGNQDTACQIKFLANASDATAGANFQTVATSTAVIAICEFLQKAAMVAAERWRKK
jgi:hypothetical protein